MPARDKKGFVKPRVMSKSTRNVRENEKPEQKRPKAQGRFWRASPSQLRSIATCLRTGEQAERSDLAAQLEARADGLPQRPPVGRPKRAMIVITQSGAPKWTGTRHEAAERLGISVATLDVQMSQHSGRWVRRQLNAKSLVISRRKPSES